MHLPVMTVQDVAERQLCCGCGACAYMHPAGIEMVDDLEAGRRPLLRGSASADARHAEALHACPGIALGHDSQPAGENLLKELTAGWGPVREVWEGFATDEEIRFRGSSGGIATALSLFALEQCGMRGVLHTAARDDIPYLNTTVLSRTREQLLAASGSRYSPASPCEKLDLIETAGGPCMFVAKPCDVAGALKAAQLRPALATNLGLTIAIFCAGTPSTRGTLEMLKKMGIDPADAVSVRYRGHGWPGEATVVARDGARVQFTYRQSWEQILSKHVAWRCRLCVDHTGEFADISVGDPWHEPPAKGDPGRSLVVVRTQRGARFLKAAIDAGCIQLRRCDAQLLPASQPNLLRVRGAVWGRMLGLHLLGIPTPRYNNMPRFRFWWRTLSLREKAKSIAGTILRVRRRGLFRRHPVVAYRAAAGMESSRQPVRDAV